MTDARAHAEAIVDPEPASATRTLLEAQDDRFEWPSFDERTAACLCYTSGTTGNPKGVLYAHRSTILHAYAAALPDGLNLSARDVVLPVVPMFHVNAWGLPYSCALTGAKLVFPGPHLDGKSLHELFETEHVTMSAGVPTVWLGLLQLHEGDEAQVLDAQGRGDRRLGLPARHDARLPGGLRRERAARLGHDRDEPARHRVHVQGKAPDDGQGSALRRAGQAGPGDLRRRHAHRRPGRQGAADGRQGLRRPAGARALGHHRLLQGRGRRPAAGRLVSDRRRGHHRPGRLHADHRPLQGRDQVGRRVDQLDRPGEHRGGAPGDRRSRGDRRQAPEVGRAPDRRGGEEAGPGSHARRSCSSSSRARSRSGGCPTTWSSSTSCRIPRPASCPSSRSASQLKDYKLPAA